MTVIIGEQHLVFATTFGAMAFSTFVFDTLDVSTRLGRYIFQELFGWTGRVGGVAATAVTVALPLGLLLAAGEGSYRTFWTLFGTSNQLLAALTLLAVSVWLHRSGRRYWFTLAPMLFVMSITLWSLALQAAAAWAALAAPGLAAGSSALNGVVAIALMLLAGFLTVEAGRRLVQPARSGGAGTS
jgi:carbon starvation protein